MLLGEKAVGTQEAVTSHLGHRVLVQQHSDGRETELSPHQNQLPVHKLRLEVFIQLAVPAWGETKRSGRG